MLRWILQILLIRYQCCEIKLHSLEFEDHCVDENFGKRNARVDEYIDTPATFRLSIDRIMALRQQRACGFVIFRRFQDTVQYLLMQTSYGEHHWTPPKGHVDPGESDMETALRETREEAGFVSGDLKIFENAKHEMTYRVNGVPKIVIYWLAELLNPDKSVKMSNEHQAYKWLPLREAYDLAKYPEMRKALNEFDEYICKNLL